MKSLRPQSAWSKQTRRALQAYNKAMGSRQGKKDRQVSHSREEGGQEVGSSRKRVGSQHQEHRLVWSL